MDTEGGGCREQRCFTQVHRLMSSADYVYAEVNMQQHPTVLIFLPSPPHPTLLPRGPDSLRNSQSEPDAERSGGFHSPASTRNSGSAPLPHLPAVTRWSDKQQPHAQI